MKTATIAILAFLLTGVAMGQAQDLAYEGDVTDIRVVRRLEQHPYAWKVWQGSVELDVPDLFGAGIHFWGEVQQQASFLRRGANLLIHGGDILLFQKHLKSELESIKQAALHVVDRYPKTTPDPVAYHQTKPDTYCFCRSLASSVVICTLGANKKGHQPVCGPSRASLLTGRLPDNIWVWHNRHLFCDTLPDALTNIWERGISGRSRGRPPLGC